MKSLCLKVRESQAVRTPPRQRACVPLTLFEYVLGACFARGLRSAAVGKLLGEMLAEPSCRNTRVVLLPSPSDATELFCFPQGPMEADLLAAIDDPAIREVRLESVSGVCKACQSCGLAIFKLKAPLNPSA